MDYYERKNKTIELIDTMIEKASFTRDDIIYSVLKYTGMSGRFVDSYINLGVTRDSISVDKDKGIVRFKEVKK